VAWVFDTLLGTECMAHDWICDLSRAGQALKVTLDNVYHAKLLVSNAPLLRHGPSEARQVYINPDRSREEQARMRTERDQRKRRSTTVTA
jgi:hypothetical protein